MTDAEKYRESIAMHYYGIVRDFVYDRLWPMLSTLEGRVSAIYSHLASRGCTLPSTPDTAHLLATVKQLDGRKVECYETDVPDAYPMGKMLLAPYSGTKLIDRTNDWKISDRRYITFSNVEYFEAGCTYIQAVNNNAYTICMPKCKKIYLPNLVNVETIGNCTMIGGMPLLEEFIAPKFQGYGPKLWGGWSTVIGSCAELKKVVFGRLTYSTRQSNSDTSIYFSGCPKLIHFEIGEGTSISLKFETWSPTLTDDNLSTFLSNFEQYIVRRLADLTGQTAQTLTLSTAVYNAISASTAVAHNADGSTMYATADYSDFGTYDEAAGRTTAVTLLKALEKKHNWNVANA